MVSASCQMTSKDDTWCMFMFTNYVFAVLLAVLLCFESLALTAVHVVVSACVPANPSAVMLYCWSSYNSVRVIFEDETGTNTEESKVHDWVRHAICSHANSICGACEREMEGEQQGEESSSWQTVPTPFLCLSSVIIAAATGGHSLLLHRL